jgi:hypothetical protein
MQMCKTTNECVDCGKPCLGNLCPNRNVVSYYCDRCGRFIQGEPKYYEDMDLCDACYGDMRGEEI